MDFFYKNIAGIPERLQCVCSSGVKILMGPCNSLTVAQMFFFNPSIGRKMVMRGTYNSLGGHDCIQALVTTSTSLSPISG